MGDNRRQTRREEEDEAVTGILSSLLCKTSSSGVEVGKITLPEKKLRPAAEVNHSLWDQGYLFCVPAEACIAWK